MILASRLSADPIRELVDAIAEDGHPPLAWIVRWSAHGREPLGAAWEASWDGEAMGQLLGVIAGPNMVCFADDSESSLGVVTGADPRRCGSIVSVRRATTPRRELPMRMWADTLRRLVPSPPLRALMAAAGIVP